MSSPGVSSINFIPGSIFNSTNGTLCSSALPVQRPILTEAYCAISTHGNDTLTNTLSNCCRGLPVKTFNKTGELSSCWQYCSFVENTTLNQSKFRTCLADAGYQDIVSCAPKITSTSGASYGAKMAWAALGIALTAAIFAVE